MYGRRGKSSECEIVDENKRKHYNNGSLQTAVEKGTQFVLFHQNQIGSREMRDGLVFTVPQSSAAASVLRSASDQRLRTARFGAVGDLICRMSLALAEAIQS